MFYAVDTEKPDYVIHLGDHSRDADDLMRKYPMLAVLSLRGNCDLGDLLTPEKAEVVYGGVRIFATHGHLYGVKNSLLRLYMAAKESAANIALFGHTHCALCQKKDDIWLLNPGSCGRGSLKTYAVITIENGNADCEIKTIDEEEHL